MFIDTKNTMLEQANLARRKPAPVLQALIFIAVMVTVQVGSVILNVVFFCVAVLTGSVTDLNMFNLEVVQNNDFVMLLSLFACAAEIILPIVYCRCIEGRSFRSMGFSRHGAALAYIKGFALGALMLGAAGGIAYASGTMHFSVSGDAFSPTIFLFLLGFMIQGIGEEVAFRGYFMVSLTNRVSMAAAVGASAVAFSLMHLLNAGINWLAVVNLILFGVFIALYMLRSDNIWGAAALHTAWNFFQGNVLGIQVSGMRMGVSLLTATYTPGDTLINGGEFGLEGGIIVTLILMAALLFDATLWRKRQQMAQTAEPADDEQACEGR